MRPDVRHFLKPTRPPMVGDIARRLRELPAEAAPPYDFAEFQRRSRERSESKREGVTWRYAAAAAGLTAVVATMAMLGTSATHRGVGATSSPAVAIAPGARGPKDSGQDRVSPARAATAAANDSDPSAVGSTTAPGSSARPVAPRNSASRSPAAEPNKDPAEQAREAREWLARQPSEPAVVRAGPRLAVASIEDRIAWFDDALTDERLRGASPAQLNLLQQERARLVSSLAQVRYAETLMADGS